MYENNQNAAAGETEDPVEFRNQKNRYPWWVKAVDTPTIEMDSKPVIPNGVKQRIQASSSNESNVKVYNPEPRTLNPEPNNIGKSILMILLILSNENEHVEWISYRVILKA